MKSFCWVMVIISSIIATFVLLFAIIGANGAPQEAAGAAIAVAIVIIPYVFTRAIEGLTGDAKPLSQPKYLAYMEQGKRHEYNGNLSEAMKAYKDAMYHLDNDYESSSSEVKYQAATRKNELKLVILDLEQKLGMAKI
jgi:hypothetical protein